MERVKIHLSDPGKGEAETRVTIPLASLHVALGVLPRKVKTALDREGIELSGLSELIGKKSKKGELIEIENAQGRLAILIE